MNFKITYTLALLLYSLLLSAQELKMRSMELPQCDVTAAMKEDQRQELNGDYVGIVKVLIAIENIRFDGGMVLDQKKWDESEYWVWIARERLGMVQRQVWILQQHFQTNPQGFGSWSYCVFRGGCWSNDAWNFRSSGRTTACLATATAALACA